MVLYKGGRAIVIIIPFQSSLCAYLYFLLREERGIRDNRQLNVLLPRSIYVLCCCTAKEGESTHPSLHTHIAVCLLSYCSWMEEQTLLSLAANNNIQPVSHDIKYNSNPRFSLFNPSHLWMHFASQHPFDITNKYKHTAIHYSLHPGQGVTGESDDGLI